jgi:hypothetical protein
MWKIKQHPQSLHSISNTKNKITFLKQEKKPVREEDSVKQLKERRKICFLVITIFGI